MSLFIFKPENPVGHVLTCDPHKGLKNCIYYRRTKNGSQSLFKTLASQCPCPGGSQQLQEILGDLVSRRDAVICERVTTPDLNVHDQVNL